MGCENSESYYVVTMEDYESGDNLYLQQEEVGMLEMVEF